jgi:hypothetical protein
MVVYVYIAPLFKENQMLYLTSSTCKWAFGILEKIPNALASKALLLLRQENEFVAEVTLEKLRDELRSSGQVDVANKVQEVIDTIFWDDDYDWRSEDDGWGDYDDYDLFDEWADDEEMSISDYILIFRTTVM